MSKRTQRRPIAVLPTPAEKSITRKMTSLREALRGEIARQNRVARRAKMREARDG